MITCQVVIINFDLFEKSYDVIFPRCTYVVKPDVMDGEIWVVLTVDGFISVHFVFVFQYGHWSLPLQAWSS